MWLEMEGQRVEQELEMEGQKEVDSVLYKEMREIIHKITLFCSKYTYFSTKYTKLTT